MKIWMAICDLKFEKKMEYFRAIRGLAGGSTPSLVLSSQHIYDDTHSECGGISQGEQRWADECFWTMQLKKWTDVAIIKLES